MVPRWFLLASLCLGLLLTGAQSCHADDWLQTRHDGFRSGASRDKTYGPLTEIWFWPDARVDIPLLQRGVINRLALRHTLNQVMIWNGRAYFSYAALPNPKVRPLVCVDSRTGAVQWIRRLNPIRVEHGFVAPSLTPAGRLYALDYTTVARELVGNPKQPLPRTTDRLTIHCISGLDGSDIATHIDMAPQGAVDKDDLRLSTFRQGSVTITHGFPSEYVSGGQRFGIDMLTENRDTGLSYGCPLILGEEIFNLLPMGMMVRWRPFEFDQWMQFAHTSGSGTTPFQSAGMSCKGFAPLSIPGGGVLVGGATDAGQTLALINPGAPEGSVCVWHRDIPGVLGMPVAAGGMIVVGVGAPGGTQSLLAFDGRTGIPRWAFAPPGPPQLNQNGSGGSSLGGSVITPGGAIFPYPDSPGIVARQGMVYAVVGYSLTALDQSSGKVIWSTPIDPTWLPRSLVASSSHLFLSVGLRPNSPKDDRAALLTYNLEDGKPLWKMPTRELGTISLANGLVYLADHGFVHTYAPAERTFRMAIDSDHAGDYQTPPPPSEQGAAGSGSNGLTPSASSAPISTTGGKAGEATGTFDTPIAPPPGIADATILRLEWCTGLEAMVARIRARRKAAPRVPLVLILNWLDPTRTGFAGKAGQLPPMEEFAETCGHLAAVARPSYFEVMSDTNAFLARYPDRAEAVVGLIRQATAAISAVSGSTRVTISYNAELLSGEYGIGTYLPFGRIARPTRESAARILSVANTVDTLAFTTYPRSAFRVHSNMPYTHLLQMRRLFPEHRLLITDVGLPLNEKLPNREEDQARYLARLLCACYWLNASVIAFPRLVASGPRDADADFALRVGKTERFALAEWNRVLQFQRVPRLSIGGPGKLPLPDAERTGLEGAERDGTDAAPNPQ